jgi:catechol 2,3-dioxygenase-like lactoylglutathione lyase family enzyme
MIKTQGLTHIHLVVRDLERSLKFYETADGKLIRRAEHSPGVPYAYLEDPDGYVIEL